MKLLRGISLIIVLLTVNGCSGNNTLESLFAPNSNLKTARTANVNEDEQNSPNNGNNNAINNRITLPEDFPDDIPIYKESRLMSIDQNTSTWLSQDPLNLITSYYQEQLVEEKWQLKTTSDNLIVATKNGEERELTLSFAVENEETKFVIKEEKPTAIVSTNQNQKNNSNSNTDIEINPSLQQLVRLNIVDSDIMSARHQTITRREYARWLVKTNNILYANFNSKLIRLANPQSKPIFSDVPNSDPDFVFIQGLAEAGLIPSSLTQDTTAIAFNPDKPLTREDLISWKVPLDFRKKLPNTTLDSLQETWGFQDISQTEPKIWSGLYVDWQNGENANIRKAFGYITLFQPQKNVSYQEAAEVLSSFGYQGDIISLQEAQLPDLENNNVN